MQKILEVDTYALKDSEGNYVNSNAISYKEGDQFAIYSYSNFLTNGPFTYSSKEKAINALLELQSCANNIKYNMKFHYEGIKKSKLILIESENNFKVGFSPFKRRKIGVGKIGQININ